MGKWEINIPEIGGTYILIMNVVDDLYVKIGCLGRHELKKGIYIYVGSARGPGGLKARIYRHLKLNKKVRWHIDYLTVNPKVKIKAIFYLESRALLETVIAKKLFNDDFFEGVVKGFGCTDKRSSYTHLYKLKSTSSIEELIRKLMRITEDTCYEERGFIIVNNNHV
jgi:Uri superfamily endonuclease